MTNTELRAKRKHERESDVRDARIYFNNGNSSLDCKLINKSSSGIRVRLRHYTPMDGEFQLHIFNFNGVADEYNCEVVWQRNLDIGIKFSGEIETDLSDRIAAALDVAVQFGNTDGDHHKQWVMDQMVRALTGEKDSSTEYNELVMNATDGEPDAWDEGIAP